MRKLCISLLSIAVFFVLQGMCFAQGAAWTVTPGVGVGPIKLGMNVKAIEAILHRDPKADQSFIHERPLWIFYKEGIQVNYDSYGNAMQIYVDKPGIATAGGVQVGDAAKSFMGEFGTKYIAHELPTAKSMPDQYLYVYKSEGVGFQIEGAAIKFILIVNQIK